MQIFFIYANISFMLGHTVALLCTDACTHVQIYSECSSKLCSAETALINKI